MENEIKNEIKIGYFIKIQQWTDLTEEANKKGYRNIYELYKALNDSTIYRAKKGKLEKLTFDKLMEKIKNLPSI